MKLRLCNFNGSIEFRDILGVEIKSDTEFEVDAVRKKIIEIGERLIKEDTVVDCYSEGITKWRLYYGDDKNDGENLIYEYIYIDDGNYDDIKEKPWLDPWKVIHELIRDYAENITGLTGSYNKDSDVCYSFDFKLLEGCKVVEGEMCLEDYASEYDNFLFKGTFFVADKQLMKDTDSRSGEHWFCIFMRELMERLGFWLSPKAVYMMRDQVGFYPELDDIGFIVGGGLSYSTYFCALFGRKISNSDYLCECYSDEIIEYETEEEMVQEKREELERIYKDRAEKYQKCLSTIIIEDLKVFEKSPADIPAMLNRTEKDDYSLVFSYSFSDTDDVAQIELSYKVTDKETEILYYSAAFERWKYVWTWDDVKKEGICDKCFHVDRKTRGGKITNLTEEPLKLSKGDRHVVDECSSVDKLKNNIKSLWIIRNKTMEELIKETDLGGSGKEFEDTFRRTIQKKKDNERYIISNEMSECLKEHCCDWLPVIHEALHADKEVSELLSEKYISDSRDLLPIPWLTIMGDAGTGKTTLAQRLAEDCFGASFMQTSPSELVSGYKNFTAHSFAMKIYSAQQKRGVGYPLVVFIDEAYSLFEQSTGNQGADGNKQLVELIINLANTKWGGSYVHDLSELSDKDNGLKNENGDPVKEVVFKHVVIWLGGYEMRLRNSMKTNEGLARRFSEPIIIPTPKREELYKAFLERYYMKKNPDDQEDNEHSTEELERAIKLSDSDRNIVNDFLSWASSRTRSSYFGNRAGVGKLVDSLIRNEKMSYGFSEALKKAVAGRKDNIQRQYSAELRSDFSRLPFEVISEIDLRLDDYIGKQSLKDEIIEVIDIMVDPGKYEKKKIAMPRGALLMGSPGSGKSFLAKCMAGEVMERTRKADKDVAFIPITGTDILAQNNSIGVIKLLFSEAAKYDAAVIFIDEIDFIGKNRNLSGSRPAILGTLMTEMDGFDRKTNIFVLAATNDPNSLDPALKRDGRFDLKFVIDHPDKETSRKLVESYFGKYRLNLYKRNGKKPQLTKEQTERAVLLLEGLMPAEVEAILKKAVLLYHRTEKGLKNGLYKKTPEQYAHRKVGNKYIQCAMYDEDNDSEITNYEGFLRDIKETLDIKYHGRRRKEEIKRVFSVDRNDESGSSIAVHEVGHALVSRILKGNFDDTERITILGRGKALGYVEPKKGLELYTQSDFKKEIMICMGGRVAEEVVYGPDNIGPGASKDIIMASHWARMMIERWGFSEEIGFFSISINSGEYLGGENVYQVSDGLREKVETEIQSLLKECMAETRTMLKNRKELILKLAEEVYMQREMTGEQIEKEYMRIDREISSKVSKTAKK